MQPAMYAMDLSDNRGNPFQPLVPHLSPQMAVRELPPNFASKKPPKIPPKIPPQSEWVGQVGAHQACTQAAQKPGLRSRWAMF